MTSIRKILSALAITAIPAALAFTATAAAANPPPTPTPANDPCTATWLVGAIACQGYYDGNLITGGLGSATTAGELTDINLLLTAATSSTPAYTPPYTGLDYDTVLAALSNLNGSATLDFNTTLSGWTIVGAHFGNIPDGPLGSNNVTAFWLIDITNPTDTLTLTNGMGSSNAQIFATGGDTRLPEPSTWAMMLFGFGAIGVAMRRSKRKTQLMSQLA